jgi:hypothetical protein
MDELFEELDAFDTKWRDRYPTTKAAAMAAGVYGLYLAYCMRYPDVFTCKPGSVPDVLGATQCLQAQQSSDSLPYRLETLGEVPDDDSND